MHTQSLEGTGGFYFAPDHNSVYWPLASPNFAPTHRFIYCHCPFYPLFYFFKTVRKTLAFFVFVPSLFINQEPQKYI